MSDSSDDRTASLMTPAKLAQLKARPKAASSPAAWLDQLATDAGSGHARRLVDLRRQLETLVRERDYESLRAALHSLYEELKKLDYDTVQPKGWLSRTLRLGKEEAAGFVARYERILRGGEDLAEELAGQQRRLQAAEAAIERSLVEFDVEVRAIEKIMEQGTRWLQDMRNQLKAREAQRDDPATERQFQEDSARCELLVARLKELRAAVAAAQKVADQSKAGTTRRAAFLQALQQVVQGEWQAWRGQLDPMATDIAGGGNGADKLEAARGAHQEVQSAMKQAARDCMQLQKQEETLATTLAGLAEPLQAAA